MALLCCLCRLSVDGNHRKRKRLHGRSCVTAREVVCRILKNALDLMEMQSPDPYLCISCDKLFNDVKSLEDKLEERYLSIKEKLTVLQKYVPSDNEEDSLRKRPRIQEESSETASREAAADTVSLAESFPTLSVERHQFDNGHSSSFASMQPSPPVKVVIPYDKGDRTYNVITPERKALIKRGTRKSYTSMATGVLRSSDIAPPFVNKICSNILAEMKAISSVDHNSFLRNSIQSVKQFEWEAVTDELYKNMPTLMSILSNLIPRSADHKPLQCMIASQLLKTRHPHMCLVQRVVSVMMYGNGVAKQVYANLQPLHICLTYQGTTNVVNKISADHDAEVKEWARKLESLMEKPSQPTETPVTQSARSTGMISKLSTADLVSSESESDTTDTSSYSVISLTEDMSTYESSDDHNEYVHVDQPCSQTPEIPLVEDESDSVQSAATPSSLEVSHIALNNHFNYKFVIDNVDKNVKPSFERAEIKGKSYHHLHGYGVQDRIDTSLLSDSIPAHKQIDPSVLLPSKSDIDTLKDELVILVSRMLIQHFDKYKRDAKMVPKHISSKYAKQMSTKSNVVPLGVLLYNENKLDEMTHILHHYMQLVPTVKADGFLILANGSKVPFDDTRFDTKLLGGDQLTVVRVRSTQALCDTLDSAVQRYSGLVPVVEDWHARVILLQVVWNRLYNTRSANEFGTMYQLRNRINRTSITKNPEKNVKATEDFLALILHAHVIAAANAIHLQQNITCVTDLARAIVEKYIHFPRPDNETVPKEYKDGKFLYASEVLSLGLFWHGFNDAICEGDGERILNYWKFLLVIFKSTNHHNYAKEATNLLMQYYYNFSEREKAQLLWSRCVNTRGICGANIPCDLHMEHLNRRLKGVIRSMGANVSPSTITKAGKALGPVHHVCQIFEEQTAQYKQSNHHKTPEFGKDLSTVLDVLENEKVFTEIPGRQHKSFNSKNGLMEKLSKKNLLTRVEKSIQQIKCNI